MVGGAGEAVNIWEKLYEQHRAWVEKDWLWLDLTYWIVIRTKREWDCSKMGNYSRSDRSRPCRGYQYEIHSDPWRLPGHLSSQKRYSRYRVEGRLQRILALSWSLLWFSFYKSASLTKFPGIDLSYMREETTFLPGIYDRFITGEIRSGVDLIMLLVHRSYPEQITHSPSILLFWNVPVGSRNNTISSSACLKVDRIVTRLVDIEVFIITTASSDDSQEYAWDIFT